VKMLGFFFCFFFSYMGIILNIKLSCFSNLQMTGCLSTILVSYNFSSNHTEFEFPTSFYICKY
jgi:hypothetical protein